jgi:hypothetical protein
VALVNNIGAERIGAGHLGEALMARRPVPLAADDDHADFTTDHKDSPGRKDYPHGDLPGGHIDMPGVQPKLRSAAVAKSHADFTTDHKDIPARDDYPHGDLAGGHIDMAGFTRRRLLRRQ